MKGQILNVNLKYEPSGEGEVRAGKYKDGSICSRPGGWMTEEVCPSGVMLWCGLTTPCHHYS